MKNPWYKVLNVYKKKFIFLMMVTNRHFQIVCFLSTNMVEEYGGIWTNMNNKDVLTQVSMMNIIQLIE